MEHVSRQEGVGRTGVHQGLDVYGPTLSRALDSQRYGESAYGPGLTLGMRKAPRGRDLQESGDELGSTLSHHRSGVRRVAIVDVVRPAHQQNIATLHSEHTIFPPASKSRPDRPGKQHESTPIIRFVLTQAAR